MAACNARSDFHTFENPVPFEFTFSGHVAMITHPDSTIISQPFRLGNKIPHASLVAEVSIMLRITSESFRTVLSFVTISFI